MLAEFGADVRIPVAVGWNLNGIATVLAYVKGREASGFGFLEMSQEANGWTISQGEIHNITEDHVLTFSPPVAAAKAAQLHGDRRLCLVALGQSATDEVLKLATFLHDECGVEAKILPALDLPGGAFDSKRKQWIVEMLMDDMAEKFPQIAEDEDARIIGVTDEDIYPRSLGWPTAFNFRVASKYGVLQTAELDPGFSKRRPNAAIRWERLRKTALKTLGIIYFDFQESLRPDSVMSFEGTLQSIDQASDHYLLSDVANQLHPGDIDGTPCLTFSAANAGGVQRLQPIHPCIEPDDLSRSSSYEVELTHGEFRTERNDFYSSGPLPLLERRMYASHIYDGKVRAFGKSTWHNLDDTVWSTDPQNIQTISIHGVTFSRMTPGTGFSGDAKYVAPDNAGEFSDALLTWEGRWKIQNPVGMIWHYMGCAPNTPIPCYFIDQTDAYGDSVAVERDGRGHISTVRQSAGKDFPSANAREWKFSYSGETIQRIEDPNGADIRYLYDQDGFLKEVQRPDGVLQYEYDADHRMIQSTENGHAVGLHYDDEGRVVGIDFDHREAYGIHYTGEAVEVTAPGEAYQIKMREGFFQLSRAQ